MRLAQFSSLDKPLQKYVPPKRAFEKYKPRGLFSEFYGMSCPAYF